MNANRFHANRPAKLTPAERARVARPIHAARVYTLGQSARHLVALCAVLMVVGAVL